MIALNNYYGCKAWQHNQCVECADRYFFNDDGICNEVPPTCKQFNRAIGICERCYFGYDIYDGKCLLSRIVDSIDRGCAKFSDGRCVRCSARWYFDENNVCQPVDSDCRKWDVNGKCNSCYIGYSLRENKC